MTRGAISNAVSEKASHQRDAVRLMLFLLLKIQNQAWFQSKWAQKVIQPLVGERLHRSLAFLGLMSIC